MLDPAIVIAQIDELLGIYDGIAQRAQNRDLSDQGADLEPLAVRIEALLDRCVNPSSAYLRQVSTVRDVRAVFRIPVLVSSIRALRADLDAGWLTTLAELVRADTFSDFLDMASELHGKGYKDPAAVVAGAVLESHLRQMCTKAGTPTTNPNGSPKKADVMNADLVKAGVYNTIVQKQITALLGVRNSAAHGKFDEYDATTVKNLIDQVTQFIANNPA